MAAIALHAQVGGFEAHVGAEGLDHGRHQIGQQACGLCIGTFGIGNAHLQGRPGGQRPRPFHERTCLQQHLLDVGMHDFQIGRLVGFHRAGQGAAHPALMGIGVAILVGDFAQPDSLDADAQPCRIHHAEHARHAGRRRTLLAGLGRFGLGGQTPGHGVVEIQHAGRLALDAHLVFDAAGVHAIARAHAAIFIDQEFWHHEEIDGRKIIMDLAVLVGDLGDHHMDDVAGQILVAARNENLGAVHLVGAVGLLDRLGLHQPQIGAAMRLGQAHGAAPFARHHFGRDGLLHPLRTRRQQRAIGARRQHGIHGQ